MYNEWYKDVDLEQGNENVRVRRYPLGVYCTEKIMLGLTYFLLQEMTIFRLQEKY